MRTVAFCEIDPFCREILQKHWPTIPICENIIGSDFGWIEADVICGGFPCQDISIAGTHGERLGIEGERSGLWREFHRVIRELRPRVVIVENTTALLHRGLGKILGDLAEIGYDAEWQCISAAGIGAPHIRDRIWILAYPGQKPGGLRGILSRLSCDGCEYPFPQGNRWREAQRGKDWELATLVPGVYQGVAASWWRHQSSVDRTDDGLPGQLDRVGALGNSVVPQIPEIIGRAIMLQEQQRQ